MSILIIISIHALLAESDVSALCLCGGACDFYPRSPCGERPLIRYLVNTYHNFYPRSPCGERRIGLVFMWWGVRFLSTLSLRRATARPFSLHGISDDFYPRSPCGERLCCSLLKYPCKIFLSTLSLRRATTEVSRSNQTIINFYPRSPCGERPSRRYLAILGNAISIHALLAESDDAFALPYLR